MNSSTVEPALARVTFHGYDSHSCRSEAAILPAPLPPAGRDAVFKKLAPQARHHPLLAKRWKLWGVLCTDDWAMRHAASARPPRPAPAKPPC
jgi:hypothetical protein